MNAQHTPGPWGIEQTSDMIWVGPLREDGHKVDDVVVGLNIGPELTATSALRQYRNARLIAAAPELLRLAYQYLSDLRYPPTGESLDRRIEEARRVILNALGDA